MIFEESIKALSKKVIEQKDSIITEEATKTAFVMPFIMALGYDVFNPNEVTPEFEAHVGIKKGEKIDYCISKDGKPIIIIECKHWREILDNHKSQLHRYFYATTTKFAILTNGIIYKFFTDSENQNKMDDDPFWEVNLASTSDSDIKELKKYHKESFDVQKIHSTAMELKYSKIISDIIKQEFNDPSDDFARFFIKNFYTGIINKKVINQYKELIKKTLSSTFSIAVSECKEIKQPTTMELFTEPPPSIKTKSTSPSNLSKIKVTLQNGEILFFKNVTETFVETIKQMGVERIRLRNLTKSGVPFIADFKDPKYNQREIGPNCYLFTNLSTEDKYNLLKELNEILETNMRIEKV